MASWEGLLILLFFGAILGDECPDMVEKCVCTEVEKRDTIKVDCSYLDLTEIPQFPITASTIILKGNQLSRIKRDSFRSAPFLRELDLSNSGVDSVEVGAFNQLSSLDRLDLSNNNLDCKQPSITIQNLLIRPMLVNQIAADARTSAVFKGCEHITELNLANNRLDSIPESSLKVLTKLQKLTLRDNDISSPVFGPDFASLALLEEVDLSGNSFEAVPSHTFQNLRSLKAVNMSRCGIKSIEKGIFNMATLHKFDISDNAGLRMDDLNETIKAVSQSPGLSVLRLAKLNITDLRYMLEALRNTDNVQLLDLSYNSLSYLNAADLRPVRSLRQLNLSHNKLVNLTSLPLSFLEKLDLSHNHISIIREQDFEGCTQLQHVDLSYNRLAEFRSDPFSRNTEMQSLDLSYNRISAIQEIIHLERLTTLKLAGNKIFNPENLFKMFELITLDLSDNKITSLTNDMITTPIELLHLNLSSNQIDSIAGDTFKEWSPRYIDLANNRLTTVDDWGLTWVKHLNLSNNEIQYVSEKALSNLQYLIELNLSHNKLPMLPPTIFQHLTSIIELDLSHNDLGMFINGPIARTAFSSDDISLEVLSLESNNINAIPENFFLDLSRLESLDLSHNSLSSISREQLNGLGLLRHLDLSYNKLSSFNVSTVQGLISLDTIDLSGTAWSCNCSISKAKKWMESSDSKITIVNYYVAGSYQCDEPLTYKATQLSELDMSQQTCTETMMEKTIIIIIIGCTSFVILVAAAIIFWQHRWRLKKKMKKQHYRAMYEGAQSQLPGSSGMNSQTNYHPHPHHHYPHQQHATPSGVVITGKTPDNHNSQAFV